MNFEKIQQKNYIYKEGKNIFENIEDRQALN